jgi:hypothetical protein
VEEDEAGKLAAFRAKFGRGWDADTDAEKVGTHIKVMTILANLMDRARRLKITFWIL